MVECQLPKLDVAGSSPVSRSINQQLARVDNVRRGLRPKNEVTGVNTPSSFILQGWNDSDGLHER